MMIMMIKMRMRDENLQNHNFDEIKKNKKNFENFLMRFSLTLNNLINSSCPFILLAR